MAPRSLWPFVSSVPADHLGARWARAEPNAFRGHTARVDEETAGLELGFRYAIVQVGYWLGWAAILVVLTDLTLDVAARHRWLLVGATLCAAACNTIAMVIPWRDWMTTARGRLLLDLWCGGLIAFVALLVVDGGPSFALLLFLTVPFIAVVQTGWRRGFWLVVSAATCTAAAALIPLSAGATAMRLSLVAAAVVVALLVTRTIRREATAHRSAARRAQLERTLAQEANHRIKNDLQTAADLLLLGRPDGPEGTAFDETAARIRSIATVHRLLTEAEDGIDGGALLRSITEDASVPVSVEADPVRFDAATAQKIGIVANELVTNAIRHGAPPIDIRLGTGGQTRLRVDDSGAGSAAGSGFGLRLVRRIVEQGLDGSFELNRLVGGGTRAEIVFPVTR